MCGILGLVQKENFEKSFNKKFRKVLLKQKRRGPDIQTTYLKENLIFGHNRLSIIDLNKRGHQPMFYSKTLGASNQLFNKQNIDKSKYSIVYNGEVYNYKEIKLELKKLKYKFTTESDTEVILAAYDKWGQKCVEKFNGMWSLVIFDKTKNILFCSRDRIGEKPFVYYSSKNEFIFGSEIPPLLELMKIKEIEIKIGYSKLSNFSLYNFKHIPFPYTSYENVFKLEPGFNLIVNLNNFKIKKNKYLKLNKVKVKENLIEQFDQLFEKAVDETTISDVPIGIFLSGGTDSSLIAAKLKNKNVTTYSIGYDKNDIELIRAKKIAKKLGLPNKSFYFKDYMSKLNLIELIKENIKIYGEPINLFQIIYSDLLLKEMKKDGIKVAIGGNGADELFYGYDGMNKLKLISDIKSKIPFIKKNSQIKSYLYSKELKNKKIIKNKFRKFNYSFILDKVSNEISSKKLIDVFSWLGLRIDNEHSITIVADLSGSKNGMEIRTPFLNKDILDYANSLDSSFKIKSYFKKRDNKDVLKKTLLKYIEEEDVYVKKMGFGYNISHEDFIFKYKKYFDHYFDRVLPKIEMYETEEINSLYKKHLEKKENHNSLLIEVIIVCIWFEMFCK